MAATPLQLTFLHFMVLAVTSSFSCKVGAVAATVAVSSSKGKKYPRIILSRAYFGEDTDDLRAWCVCKEGLSDVVLQKTLDYTCGAGADCNPIKPKGACFNPDTVRAHCSYAVNSYFQKKGEIGGTCDFGGTAAVVGSDPSYLGCVYPNIASASTTSNVPTGATISPHTNTTSTTGTNPNVGPLVGVGGGFGTSGPGINDENKAGNLEIDDV
ncbi:PLASMODESMATA CALLOSE-BINDING PROTEIN 3-like protein [Drosera capensis]